MPEQKKAVALLILAALLWSTGGLLIKWVHWNPMAIAGMRGAITAIFLWGMLRRPQFVWSPIQIGGGVACAVTTMLFITATKLTTAANAIFLLYTAPIYVAAFSAWFLQEQVIKLDWLTILLVIGGMALFFLDNLTLGGWWGNICAILGGISFAWIVLTLRKQHRASSLETVLLGNIIAAVAGLPFMFDTMPDLSSWIGLFLLGVVQLGFPYMLYARAIKNVKAIEAILISAIEPILNPIWVFLLLGEKPSHWAIIGGTIVILAVTARGLVMVLATPDHPWHHSTIMPDPF